MSDSNVHSRRDFLRGKAAVLTVVDKARELIDTAAGALGSRLPAPHVVHLEASRRAMACEFSIRFHEKDSHATEHVMEALDLIESIETRLTIYRETSEVLELNRQAAEAPVPVDDKLWGLLTLAEQIYHETQGAFDITSTPLSRCWGFLQRQGRRPADEEIAAALDVVGFHHVHFDPPWKPQRREMCFASPAKAWKF